MKSIKRSSIRKIINTITDYLMRNIALVPVVIIVIAASGWTYITLEALRGELRGTLGIVGRRGLQSVTEGLMVTFSYTLSFIGLVAMYRGVSLSYNPRVAITYILLGVLLLVISFLLFYVLILIKITG